MDNEFPPVVDEKLIPNICPLNFLGRRPDFCSYRIVRTWDFEIESLESDHQQSKNKLQDYLPAIHFRGIDKFHVVLDHSLEISETDLPHTVLH